MDEDTQDAAWAQHEQEGQQWAEMMAESKRISAELRDTQNALAAGDERIRRLVIESMKASSP